MHVNGDGHALLRPGEGEVIEVGGNRLVIKVASASQLVCEYTAWSISPVHRCAPARASMKPSSSSTDDST
jgi:hypothetical protein